MISTLNSKDLIINQEDQDFLSLDPAPILSDHSIEIYHQRVQDLLPCDRSKLAVMMPANDWMERVTENLDSQARNDRNKFKIYVSDLMIKFVEKLETMLGKKGVERAPKGGNDPAHDRKNMMSRSETVLHNISAQVFTQRTGLHHSYRKTIAAFEDIVEERNKLCHETGLEFACLLLTKQFQDPANWQFYNCDHWSPLLLWVTGYDTLEDMAAAADRASRVPLPIK